MKTKKKAISAKEFDEKFDKGEDLSDHVDWDKGIKKINLDIPIWAIRELDQEAGRRGIARKSLIKSWVIDRLDALRKNKTG